MKRVAALVVLWLGACASWQPARTAPLLEVGFGAGVRVPAKAEDHPLVSAQVTAGAVRWWRRGADGPARQHVGLGGVFTLSWFDLQRVDLGADLILAPPRGDRRVGFQFRIGARVSTDGAHAGPVFAAEWSDALVGSLFAEAGYDARGEEGEFLFGARVNLFFPVAYVRTDLIPMN